MLYRLLNQPLQKSLWAGFLGHLLEDSYTDSDTGDEGPKCGREENWGVVAFYLSPFQEEHPRYRKKTVEK